MLIRSLTLATLMAFTGPLLAADDINPLKQDLGKARPLVVVELDSGNPTLATLKKQLEDPATKQSFEERNMVFYTVSFGSIGAEGEKFAKDPKDAKKLTPPETNALIRALNRRWQRHQGDPGGQGWREESREDRTAGYPRLEGILQRH